MAAADRSADAPNLAAPTEVQTDDMTKTTIPTDGTAPGAFPGGSFPGLADPLAMPIGALRAMASAGQTMSGLWPAACLVAASPFFWAPPLWILALMAAPAAGAGNGTGSEATKPPMGPPMDPPTG